MSGQTHVLVGDKVALLPQLEPGQRLLPVTELSELLVLSEAAQKAAREAVARANASLQPLRRVSDAAISQFFESFAALLEDPTTFEEIAKVNASDVESAQARGRSTGRLRLTESMRRDMIDGLRGWASAPSRVGELVERRQGEGFAIERRRAPLGLVAFVFEGRPNVFADAAGVLRNRNAAVFRIGGDALNTAVAIEELALRPALVQAGLPEGALTLVRSTEHGAAQALFCERSIRLAVARGSGRTVALLGAVARQHGIPVSLHGTGGAWMYIEPSAKPETVRNAIVNSLDRKVCNTLNVLLLDRAAVPSLGPVVEQALREAKAEVAVLRGSEGTVTAKLELEEPKLGHEWEWDSTPEISFGIVDGLGQAAALFNQYSPRFVASILSTRAGAFEQWADAVEAPYVGNAFTRWVDGQWAWLRPELGLTNWESGRLLGRSGFLSGDDITSVRDFFVDETGLATQRR
ncbi:MAG: glutamate-5-semialdehyde dehydrogenase [Polyangiaceae bacterium]|jgi:glutamate-5-semialdehyde dehydrogenase|nr:glutamate-5-semialdehyde dehydrogenase [Polyangiaceae bacterium]